MSEKDKHLRGLGLVEVTLATGLVGLSFHGPIGKIWLRLRRASSSDQGMTRTKSARRPLGAIHDCQNEHVEVREGARVDI